MKHILFVPAFVLLAATAFVGCSDDKKEPDPPHSRDVGCR